MTETTVAALDLGTNSVKCLVARLDANGILQVVSEQRRITRLGEGLLASGRLLPSAVFRTSGAVREMVESARRQGAQAIALAATAAMREAENARELSSCVLEETGVDIVVVSGEDEARLSFLGARTTPGLETAPVCLIDIGGGSCEWAMGNAEGINYRVSLPLGAVRLTETYLHGDPPSPSSIGKTAAEIDRQLAGIPPPAGLLAGVGGTFSAMAAVAQLRSAQDVRIDGYRMTAMEMDRQIVEYASFTVEQRRNITGLEPGRADIILAGALVARRCLARARAQDIVVTGRGLRFGLALELATGAWKAGTTTG